jgi:hypothetical protein
MATPRPHPDPPTSPSSLAALLTSLQADATALDAAWAATTVTLGAAARVAAAGAVDHAALLHDGVEGAAAAADAAADAGDAAAAAGVGLSRALRGADALAEGVARVRRRLEDLEARVSRVL